MTQKGRGERKVLPEFDSARVFPLAQAIDLVQQCARARFDETVDVAIRLGVDTRQADQTVRGSCALPHGTGKTVRVAVFARGVKAEEAKAAGADVVGAEDLAAQIQEGFLEFDRCIATPDMMGLVGPLGRFLGPRGLMPNPKLGTVSPDVVKAVNFVKGGAVEFRAEKAGIIHASVGKVSFSQTQLLENILTLLDTIIKAKPSGSKGTYLLSLSIASTMGPGIKVDLSDINVLIGNALVAAKAA